MKRFHPVELLLFALTWLVALAVVARGAEPKLIDAPEQIAAYKLVDVKIVGTWESALFTVEPEAQVDSRASADGKTLTFVAPPGSYTVRVVAVSFTAKKLAQAKAVVVIGKPGPTPPTPGPTPDPVPVPVPTKLWAIVMEETKERTTAQAAVLLSPKVEALFDKHLRIIDPWNDDGTRRSLESSLVPYADRSEAIKIKPALFIVSPDGTVYFEGRLPDKVADLESIVAKIRKGEKP